MIIRDLFVVYLNTLNNLNIDKIISRIFNRVSFFFLITNVFILLAT